MKRKIDITALVRPNILKLTPYRSARNDFKSGILLDANENAFGAPFDDHMELHRYPMPYQEELREKIAELRGVRPQNVFTGVGSDEAIDLLFRIFCVPGKDRIITTPPTYGMYTVSANIHDVLVDEVILTSDFQPDTDRILEAANEQTKLLFLCSPNNPTANNMSRDDIFRLADEFNGILVVDEAYIDFSEEPSLAVEVLERNNLVVLQTLSKAFGLAGIRLGMAIASPEIINLMLKVKAPYNVNKLTSQAALRGLSFENAMRARVQHMRNEREKIADRLSSNASVEKVYPSDANFLLFRVKNALSLYQKMAEQGVIVRYRGHEPHCNDCLRLTIGTPEENNRFFDVFESLTRDMDKIATH